MSFPTTQWGNVGNTLASTQISADIYTSIPGPSATVPGSADGPVLGNFQWLPDGTFIQFLQATATFNKNLVGKVATATAWQNNFVTIPTAAANDLVICVNDRGLANLVALSCTWFTMRGLAFAQTLNAVAAGKIVAASGVAGQLYGATAGTDLQGNMVNTVLVGGAPASSPVYMM